MEQIMEKPRASWVPLLAMFTFAGFVETIFYGQLTAFTPLYLPHIGISPQDVSHWTGIIAGVAGLVGLPFLPFWGALADRFARKPVIIRSFVVEFVTCLIAILAGNIWVFVLARAISSLALGNSGLMMATLSERAPDNRQGLAFSIMNGAGPIGAFLGPLIGGPIIDHLGFRALLAIDAGLLLLVVLTLAFGYVDHFRPPVPQPLLHMAAASVRAVVSGRLLRAIFGALFCLFGGWMLVTTYASLAVAKLYTGPDLGTRVGLVLGVGGFVALIVSPVMGTLADRFGSWRVLLIAGAAAIFLWLLPYLAENLIVFTILYSLVNGLTTGLFSISFNVLAKAAPEDIRGRIMAMAYLPLNVGLVLGPLIGSFITRRDVFTIFPTAAGLAALGTILLLSAYRQHQGMREGTYRD